jgi:iron complex outermembrane receptor protein
LIPTPSPATVYVDSGPIPELFVRASPSLLPEVGRSNDTQPYIVLTRDALHRSSTGSLADFLRTAASAIASNSRSRPDPFTALPDQIDLRGLGSSQTLVLIDGRRLAGLTIGGEPLQPDLSAVP